MNKKTQLRNQIDAWDFMITETVLFLDTHPTNRRAMANLETAKQRRAAAVKEYEAAFGPYIKQAEDGVINNRWTWLDSPWPWEE